MSEVSFDDDLLRARHVQGWGPVAPLPPETLAPKPMGLSPLSSLGSAEPQFSPILERPRANIMLDVLRAQNRAEELAKDKVEQFETSAKKSQAKIDELSSKNAEIFRKEVEAAKNRDTWSTFAVVAQYISSVSAITLGASIGGVPGFLIGAAGVVGGGVRLAHDTHLLEPIIEWVTESKELQASIQQNIDLYGFYLQMGLGLAGGVAAYQAGTFAAWQAMNATDYMTRAASVLSTASTVAQAGGQIGAKYYEKHLADLGADTRENDYGLTAERQALTKETRAIEGVLSDEEEKLKLTRSWIQKQEIHT